MSGYYFEAFLKVVVLFEEHSIIDDDLRCSNAEVNNSVIHSFCRLNRKNTNKDRIRKQNTCSSIYNGLCVYLKYHTHP